MIELYFVHDQQEIPTPRVQFLEMSGFRVSTFESGAALLAALSEHKPDLVLMDVLLPGAHGFDVCRLVRHQYPAEELPVLLSSELYRTRVYRDEAALCGAQDYLVRPIDPAHLVDAITRAVDTVRGSV